MLRTIGIGVIGMGWMGLLHAQAYRQVCSSFDDAELQPRLIICADDLESRAMAAHDRLGFETFTTNWRDVINHPDVEVVDIATPNNMHLECVRAAAEAGKHVNCEKPVGRSPEETAQAEYAARKAGVTSFVGFNYRWAPMVQFARNLIQEGQLGQITHARGRFFAMYGSNPLGQFTWRFDENVAGLGALSDIMSHVVDMLHMLVGPISRVTANVHTFIPARPVPGGPGALFGIGQPGDPLRDVTNDDYAGALVQFANGARGTLEVSRVVNGPLAEFAFELHGTKGALRWSFERMNELDVYLPDGTGGHAGYTRIMSGPAHPFHANFNPAPGNSLGYNDLKVIEAHQFLKSIATGQQSPPSLTDALATASVLATLIRSNESGTWEPVKSLRIESATPEMATGSSYGSLPVA